jgi:hypothetical protein
MSVGKRHPFLREGLEMFVTYVKPLLNGEAHMYELNVIHKRTPITAEELIDFAKVLDGYCTDRQDGNLTRRVHGRIFVLGDGDDSQAVKYDSEMSCFCIMLRTGI